MKYPACMHDLIGRDAELTALCAALGGAQSGRSQAVLLTGEPGIGKTAIARAFAEIAAQRGALVLWGRCFEDSGAPAYWPWIQITRQFAQRQDDDALCVTLGSGAGCVVELCAELKERLPGVRAPMPLSDPAQARFRTFDAVAQFWMRAAAAQPLLLIFEDLHWADAASLRLLEFVAAEVGGARILIVATFRDSEPTAQHPLRTLQSELQRKSIVQRVTLAGLHSQHISELVQAAAGIPATPAAIAFVQNKTAGNPLFVLEVAHYLAREGRLTSSIPLESSWHVPGGIRAFIAARLQSVSSGAQRALQAAAVIGSRFCVRLLQRALADDSRSELLRALDEAQRAHLIEPSDEAACFQFGHVLTRDTLYDELPLLERARLHERIGLALEADHRHRLAPYLSLLAHHFIAALPVGSIEKALSYAIAAAEDAHAQHAYEEASRCFALALDVLQATAAPDAKLRCKVLIALGSARIKAGQMLHAVEPLREAATEAAHLGTVSDLAQAAIEFEEAAWRLGMEGHRAIELLQLSLGLDAETDELTRVKLQSALVRAQVFAGMPDSARVLHQQTLQLARRLGDPQALQVALRSRFWLPWEPAELETILASADEALAVAQHGGTVEQTLDASAFRLHLLLAIGDVNGFAAELQHFTLLAEDLQQPFHRYHAVSMRAAQALAAGRFDDAETLARAALKLGAPLPGLDASGAYGMQMFTIARERGELPQLAPLVKQFVEGTPDSAAWQPALALVLAEIGKIEEARASLTQLAARQFQSVAHDSLWLVCIAYLAETCALVREPAPAAELYAMLAPWSGRNVVAGSVVVCYGPVDRFLGMLCAVMGRCDRARGHFDAALAMCERQANRPWLASTQYEYSAMLLERGDKNDALRAGGLLESARQIADQLGMARLQDRVSQLELKLKPRSLEAAYPGGLSRREAQVLRLIAAGKSNQQIADEMFRSPNTVANHVRSILAKLGTANRTEAAIFAARHGLI